MCKFELLSFGFSVVGIVRVWMSDGVAVEVLMDGLGKNRAPKKPSLLESHSVIASSQKQRPTAKNSPIWRPKWSVQCQNSILCRNHGE